MGVVFHQRFNSVADLPWRCKAREGEVPAGNERVGGTHEGDGAWGSHTQEVSAKTKEGHCHKGQEKDISRNQKTQNSSCQEITDRSKFKSFNKEACHQGNKCEEENHFKGSADWRVTGMNVALSQCMIFMWCLACSLPLGVFIRSAFG